MFWISTDWLETLKGINGFPGLGRNIPNSTKQKWNFYEIDNLFFSSLYQ